MGNTGAAVLCYPALPKLAPNCTFAHVEYNFYKGVHKISFVTL